jgi:predicted phosphoribosyltransferase
VGAPKSSYNNDGQSKCATLSAACPVGGEELKAKIQEELKKAFCNLLPHRTNVFLMRFYKYFEVIVSSPVLLL